jgi:hypothetical protein
MAADPLSRRVCPVPERVGGKAPSRYSERVEAGGGGGFVCSCLASMDASAGDRAPRGGDRPAVRDSAASVRPRLVSWLPGVDSATVYRVTAGHMDLA